jgi:hypothetical protein
MADNIDRGGIRDGFGLTAPQRLEHSLDSAAAASISYGICDEFAATRSYGKFRSVSGPINLSLPNAFRWIARWNIINLVKTTLLAT